MKGRTWVLVLILVLSILFGGYVVAVQHYRLDVRARDYVNNIVSTHLGVDFKTTSFFFLPWAFGLKNATLTMKDIPLVIEAKRIRIEFDLLSMIKNRHNLVSGTRRVFLDEPRFIWSLSDSTEKLAQKKIDRNGDFSLAELPAVRVHIVRGSFRVTRGDTSLVLAENIGGLLDGFSGNDIRITAQGRVLSDTLNTRFTLNIERKTGRSLMTIGCNNADFSNRNLAFITGDVIPESGLFSCAVNVEKNGTEINPSGGFMVTGASFFLRDSGIRVSSVAIDGRIDTNEVVFETVTGDVLSVKPELSGRLLLRPEIKLDLSLKAADVDIGEIVPSIVPEWKEYPTGIVQLSARIEGPINNLIFGSQLLADSLTYRGNRFESVEAMTTISEKKVILDRLNFRYRGYKLKCSGRTNLPAAGGRNDFIAEIRADSEAVEGLNYLLNVQGFGRPKQNRYTVSYGLTVNPPKGNLPKKSAMAAGLDTYRGSLNVNKDLLDFTINNEKLTAKGTSRINAGRRYLSTDIVATRLPALYYAGKETEALIIDGTASANGLFDSLNVNCRLAIDAGKNFNAILDGSALIGDVGSPSRRIAFNGMLHETRLRYSKSHEWDVSFRADKGSSSATVRESSGALLKIGVNHESGALSGSLDLSSLPLEWIVDIFKREEFSHKGRISGHAIIGGTIQHPSFSTPEPITVAELNIGGLDKMSGSCSVSGAIDELNFTDAHISRRGMPVFEGEGRWRDGSPFIVTAKGNGVELGAVGDIISLTRLTDGDVTYEADLSFTQNSGTIAGKFSVTDGHFMDVPFDTAKGTIGGGSSGFKVTGFTVEKRGVFSGRGDASSGYFWEDETEATGLKMNLVFSGDLFRALPYLTTSIKKASCSGRLSLTMGGVWEEPVVMDGEMQVSHGVVEPSFLVDSISDITGLLVIDPTFKTKTGYAAVRIKSATGRVLGKELTVRNVHIGEDEWEYIKKPELLSIINGTVGLDFGVLLGRVEKGNSRDATLELTIPGFMKPKDIGAFLVSGDYRNSFIVGAADAGDHLSPFIGGSATVLSGDITFPLLDVEGAGDSSFLDEIFWDVIVNAGPNVNYIHEENIRWRVGGTTVTRTLAKLDENSRFTVYGRLADDSFHVTGYANSNSGLISYYGTEFDIERAEFRLDTANELRPSTLAARARTVVYDDSTGAETEIRLNIYFIDKISGERRELDGRTDVMKSDFRAADTSRTIDAGALGILQIEFTSSNPSDNSMENILARLGISSGNIVNAATGAFAAGIDNYYFDSIMRPFEDAIRKFTKIDVVRFTPSVLGNFMRSQIGNIDRLGPDNEMMLFDRSRIMLGEYILNDFFLSYKGQYGLGRDYLSRKERGFYHEIGLQYLLKRNTRFQLNYNYDEIISKGEKRIEIRHDFEF